MSGDPTLSSAPDLQSIECLMLDPCGERCKMSERCFRDNKSPNGYSGCQESVRYTHSTETEESLSSPLLSHVIKSKIGKQ